MEKLICQENGRVFVGDQEFTSASSALLAYIELFKNGKSIFSGASKTKSASVYERNVSSLLLPKSCLQLTAERSLQSGIRHTPQEIQLFNQKKEIQNKLTQQISFLTTFNINSKVNQTIKETETFLSHLQNRCASPSSLCCVSDIGSLTTECLITANPYPKSKTNPTIKNPDGTSKKCQSCTPMHSGKKTKTIFKEPLNGSTEIPLPLPISLQSLENRSGNLGFCCQNSEKSETSKELCSEAKNADLKNKKNGQHRKIVNSDSRKKELVPKAEMKKLERLTCSKAGWQDIECFKKNPRMPVTAVKNCKSKKVPKISNNAMSNQLEKLIILSKKRSESYSKIFNSSANTKEISAEMFNQEPSALKKNSDKSISFNSLKQSVKSKKDIRKLKENNQECIFGKNIESVKKEEKPSGTLLSKKKKKDSNDSSNSQKMTKKDDSSIHSLKTKSENLYEIQNNFENISDPNFQQLHESRTSEISAHYPLKNLESFFLDAENNNPSKSQGESVPQNNQKSFIKTNPDLPTSLNYKTSQVPNWVKDLEYSVLTPRKNTFIPADICQTLSRQASPSNIANSWSISNISFVSPQLNPEKMASYTPQKKQFSEFQNNIDADNDLLLPKDYDDLPNFNNQSLQSLLDRYLNDQTKEQSTVKLLDSLTEQSTNGLDLKSRKPNNGLSSNLLEDDAICSQSPQSHEAVFEDPGFDKFARILKVPFISSTPKTRNHCIYLKDANFDSKVSPFWDDKKFEPNSMSDEEREEHRCMETLKNMLFKLQVEEKSIMSSLSII